MSGPGDGLQKNDRLEAQRREEAERRAAVVLEPGFPYEVQPVPLEFLQVE